MTVLQVLLTLLLLLLASNNCVWGRLIHDEQYFRDVIPYNTGYDYEYNIGTLYKTYSKNGTFRIDFEVFADDDFSITVNYPSNNLQQRNNSAYCQNKLCVNGFKGFNCTGMACSGDGENGFASSPL